MANEPDNTAPTPPSVASGPADPNVPEGAGVSTAKRYERLKLWLHLGELAFVVAALAVFYFTGGSRMLAASARQLGHNEWGAVAVYVAALLMGGSLLTLPWSYFGGFQLEHRFNLSNQTLAGQNLADMEPHPWVEFLFHDHPALSKRIAKASEWRQAVGK